MFVRKVAGNFVDVFFLVNLQKGIQEVAATNFTTCDTTGMAFVDTIKDTGNHGDGILFLELGMIAQEFEALEFSLYNRRLIGVSATQKSVCTNKQTNNTPTKINERTG